KKSSLLETKLPIGYFDPMITRVIIIVTFQGMPHVLMDGIVTRQEMSPSNDVGQSTLTVTGEDLTILMDLIEKVVPYPSMPDVVRVSIILEPYLLLGITPVVILPPVSTTQLATHKIEYQASMTDLDYIKTLASRNGYVFYLRPGPLPGQNVAYFGPDINMPIPQSALNINMDALTNVESLSFSLDGRAKKICIFTVFDPVTRKIPVPIPLPNVSLLKPPLGLRPTAPSKVEIYNNGGPLEPDEAARDILSFLMSNSTAISGNGSLDVLKYGRILRARTLVGVRGAGIAYDGLYFVDTVTHNIKRGEYKQNFTLSRDGLISNTPRVVP
ncbi:MAG: hypothetical protein D3906_12050, partial [Candidatus Electrothrix sp. AUS1_2]|nr:hypothetical protein [Candidatus Electrothrix sp. AUS1_2]